jgi:LPXTG-motif cell wall-anchored protein
MNHLITIHLLGATGYGCDAYGANAYGECSDTSTNAPGTADNNLLANTGYDILLPLALGLSILIASAILLFKRVRRHLRRR